MRLRTTLLRESFPQIVLPDVMAPLRDTDAPGAVCYRVTPELYLGYQRGRIGNTAGLMPDKPATYKDIGKHAEGYFFLEGDWLLGGESAARPVGAHRTQRCFLAAKISRIARTSVVLPTPGPPVMISTF